MFKIGVQTGGIDDRYGVDGAYRIIREAGFDAADANIDHLMDSRFADQKEFERRVAGSVSDFLPLLNPWRDAAKKYGIDNYQAHAPFPCYVNDETGARNNFLIEMLKKMIAGADYIGCRNLIVHPFFLGYGQPTSPEDEWELNIAQYSKLIPAAKEYGVTICLENMFTGHRGKVYEAICSDIPTACRYVDTLNGIAGQKCFGFCLDTGHMLLVGKDIRDVMIELGERIVAFHAHDNDGWDDQHLAPYMGILDWNRFVEGLRAIRFSKTLSFETFNVWNVVDPEIAPYFMKAIAETGRMFDRRASE